MMKIKVLIELKMLSMFVFIRAFIEFRVITYQMR